MTYAEMLNKVITMFGFEDSHTIWFANVIDGITEGCEWNDTIVKASYDILVELSKN